ncbi:uncharacterized protein J3R85_018754 [Psidium guajava]|nr:uncharacterized protein J3R85_018754 [Psidium guajava]
MALCSWSLPSLPRQAHRFVLSIFSLFTLIVFTSAKIRLDSTVNPFVADTIGKWTDAGTSVEGAAFDDFAVAERWAGPARVAAKKTAPSSAKGLASAVITAHVIMRVRKCESLSVPMGMCSGY